MKAFLGMGLLGSHFVRAMIAKGDTVQVWNRTFSKAKDMEQFGAKAFPSVVDAVKEASIIHMAVKDDASVDEVLQAAREGFAPGAIIVDHTTTSKEGAIKRTQEWQQKGFQYQHAPVFMGPANALESTGFMLVSGDQELVGQLEQPLSKMTGKLMNFGAEAGKAAAIKLIGNAFLVSLTAGIRDSLLLAKALDIPASDVSTLFQSWNPGSILPARVERITSGDYSNPSWELDMARKDTGLFIDAALKGGTELMLIPAIAKLMDQFIARGHGAEDWTVIAKDAL